MAKVEERLTVLPLPGPLYIKELNTQPVTDRGSLTIMSTCSRRTSLGSLTRFVGSGSSAGSSGWTAIIYKHISVRWIDWWDDTVILYTAFHVGAPFRCGSSSSVALVKRSSNLAVPSGKVMCSVHCGLLGSFHIFPKTVAPYGIGLGQIRVDVCDKTIPAALIKVTVQTCMWRSCVTDDSRGGMLRPNVSPRSGSRPVGP